MPARTRRPFSLFVLSLALLCGAAAAGDFGDAPDGGPTGYAGLFAQIGRFPTLAASGGAVANGLDEARLGPTSSDEQDANDPNDPDGRPNLDPANNDSDDGLVNFTIALNSIPPPAFMSVDVTAPPGSSGGTYFVNVLIDLNLDGQWGGVVAPGLLEWVVRNFPVVLTPGTSQQVQLPPFAFGFGNRLPDGAWMRIVLSDSVIRDVDWDGSGTFANGEVEDHVIRLPEVKSCIPRLSFPRRVRIPAGANSVFFLGRLRNVGATTCDVDYDLNRIFGGVNILALFQICAPGFGPVLNCNFPALAPAAPPGTPLLFVAFRGNLPSRFTYRAAANDPPAIITPEGVILGYDDSIGDVDFEEVDLKIKYVKVEYRERWVLLHLLPKKGAPPLEYGVVLTPGESFRGVSYEAALENGEGLMEMPAEWQEQQSF